VHIFSVDTGAEGAGHALRRASRATRAAHPTVELAAPTSSHGLGVGQAVELARALDRLPRKLVVVGVEGADFGQGTDLTGAVAAIEPAARLVTGLVKRLASRASPPSARYQPWTRLPAPAS
jgi:hypothetical protein